jgi:hypothetical protein
MQDQKVMAVRGWLSLKTKTHHATLTRKRQLGRGGHTHRTE